MDNLHVTALTINRLGEREIACHESTASQATSRCAESIRLDIIERTDGIPLFVEEMTKAVLEAESDKATRRQTGCRSSALCSIRPRKPARVPQMARLDRPRSAKDVAQIGAAIGREFFTLCWLRW